MSDKLELIKKLIARLELRNYAGYDPYDALNSPLPWEKMGRYLPVLFIQFLKRFPINIRPLLRIKRGHNPKAMGMFLHAFCNLYKKTGDEAYKVKADYFFNWLLTNANTNYSGKSWGYNFLWISPIRKLPAYTPSAVVTAFICRGLFAYYQICRDIRAKKLIIEASEFILNDLPVYADDSGICFSYTPLQEEVCYNASLLAAEVLSYRQSFQPSDGVNNKIKSAIDFVVTRQRANGSWAYSEQPEKRTIREQIDFHQGFLLDSFKIITEVLPEYEQLLNPIILKGLEYYRERQFSNSGQACFRLPKKYPVDIHFVAQGIISFSRFGQYKKFSEIIAGWAIHNMLDAKHYFYYRKGKLFTNKIDYIRWGQAWMLLALSELL